MPYYWLDILLKKDPSPLLHHKAPDFSGTLWCLPGSATTILAWTCLIDT